VHTISTFYYKDRTNSGKVLYILIFRGSCVGRVSTKTEAEKWFKSVTQSPWHVG